MKVAFSKYHSYGNDFILIDDPLDALALNENIRKWCHRHFGIGADGVIALYPLDFPKFKMRIFNSDGGEALMCGNGLRCCAEYLFLKHKLAEPIYIASKLRTHLCWKEKDRVYTSLTPNEEMYSGKLSVFGVSYSYTLVDTGVPHAVIPCNCLSKIDVKAVGKAIAHHKQFAPMSVNVTFMTQGKDTCVRVYERGVEKETYGCGTGAAAAALLTWKMRGGKDRPLTVKFHKCSHVGIEHFFHEGLLIAKGVAWHVFDGEVMLPSHLASA